MKSKIYLLWSLLLALVLLTLGSCKSQESAYKVAFEQAKAREIGGGYTSDDTTQPPTQSTEVSPTVKVQKETVTVIDGAGIKQFSVVVGSFINRTNAEALKTKMASDGFSSFLAQNGRGMFRVIVATYSDKANAAAERNRIKEKYYPNFQDAWILDNQ